MPELLIVADDLTGALDTGVQLVKLGLPARILPAPCAGAALGADGAPGSGEGSGVGVDPIAGADRSPVADGGYTDWDEPGGPVLVLVAETRHCAPEEAYRTLSAVFRKARDLAVPVIYKKTDSALRGNIGSELQAMLDVYPGESVCFVPAFPAAGRTTQGGVQYIDGRPVADSPFGRDPLSPVRESFIPAWLREKGLVHPCRPVGKGAFPFSATEGYPGYTRTEDHVYTDGETRVAGEVFIFDADTDEDLRRIVSAIHAAAVPEGRLRLMAGCAGFAQMLPRLLRSRGEASQMPPDAPAPQRASHSRDACDPPVPPARYVLPDGPLLVFSGSRNEITLEQIAFAAKRGFICREISEEILFAEDTEADAGTPTVPGEADVILYPAAEAFLRLPPRQATGPDPHSMAQRMGLLGKQLRDRFPDRLMMVVGGDTLAAFLRNIGTTALFPLDEIEPGVVLAKGMPGDFLCIAKSGGLGGIDTFIRVREYSRDHRKSRE